MIYYLFRNEKEGNNKTLPMSAEQGSFSTSMNICHLNIQGAAKMTMLFNYKKSHI